jgi:hypothetical protein
VYVELSREFGSRANLTLAMFYPKDNPGYYEMADAAKKLIVEWSTNDWYESSTGDGSGTFGIEHEL